VSKKVTRKHIGKVVMVRNHSDKWKERKLIDLDGGSGYRYRCQGGDGCGIYYWKYAKPLKKKKKKCPITEEHVGQYILVRDYKWESWKGRQLVRIAKGAKSPFVCKRPGSESTETWKHAKLEKNRSEVTPSHIGSTVYVSDTGGSAWCRRTLSGVRPESSYPYRTGRSGCWQHARLDRPDGPPPTRKEAKKAVVEKTEVEQNQPTSGGGVVALIVLAVIIVGLVAALFGFLGGTALSVQEVKDWKNSSAYWENQADLLNQQLDYHTKKNKQIPLPEIPQGESP